MNNKQVNNQELECPECGLPLDRCTCPWEEEEEEIDEQKEQEEFEDFLKEVM